MDHQESSKEQIPIWLVDELQKFNPDLERAIEWEDFRVELEKSWRRTPASERARINFIAVDLGFDIGALGFQLVGSRDPARSIELEPMPVIRLSNYQELSQDQKQKYLSHAGKLVGGRAAQVKWSLEIAPFFKDKDRMALIGMTQQGGRDGFSDLKKRSLL